MQTKNSFSVKLKRLREERGLSQAELARLADVAPAQLSRYEVGKAVPRLEVITRLAAALKVEADELSALNDLTLSIIVTSDMLETMTAEAEEAGCSVEHIAGNRLLNSFYPEAGGLPRKEHVEYLQSIVSAFEATSPDFKKELGERMAEHLANIMRTCSTPEPK